MSYTISRLLPLDIIDLIYEYKRDKCITDYDYKYYKSATQLFFYHNMQPLNDETINLSYHFWVYNIWLDRSHPKIKAIEIKYEYDLDDNPKMSVIHFINKQCEIISSYMIKDNWQIAFEPNYCAFSIKKDCDLDVWEKQRWELVKNRLNVSCFLDYYLQKNLFIKRLKK